MVKLTAKQPGDKPSEPCEAPPGSSNEGESPGFSLDNNARYASEGVSVAGLFDLDGDRLPIIPCVDHGWERRDTETGLRFPRCIPPAHCPAAYLDCKRDSPCSI